MFDQSSFQKKGKKAKGGHSIKLVRFTQMIHMPYSGCQVNNDFSFECI